MQQSRRTDCFLEGQKKKVRYKKATAWKSETLQKKKIVKYCRELSQLTLKECWNFLQVFLIDYFPVSPMIHTVKCIHCAFRINDYFTRALYQWAIRPVLPYNPLVEVLRHDFLGICPFLLHLCNRTLWKSILITNVCQPNKLLSWPKSLAKWIKMCSCCLEFICETHDGIYFTNDLKKIITHRNFLIQKTLTDWLEGCISC